MTIKFSIFQDEELMVAKFSGHISDVELIEQYRNYYESNEGIANFNQLVLFDEATILDLEMESFIEVSKMAGEYLKNSERSIKTAFVTEKTLHKILSDTYKSISDAKVPAASRKTFTNIEAALLWLEVNSDANNFVENSCKSSTSRSNPISSSISSIMSSNKSSSIPSAEAQAHKSVLLS